MSLSYYCVIKTFCAVFARTK